MDVPDTAASTGRRDRVAGAVGNASLLGIGYVLIGRRALALGTIAVTLLLLFVLGVTGSTGAEVVVVLWWLATMAHGWFLAARNGPPGRDVRRRLLASVAAAAVLLTVAVLRVDAAAVAGDVEDARARGDCPEAVRAGDDRWFGSRLADAPAAADGDATTEACTTLAAARDGFGRALQGDLGSLGSAYERLAQVQRRYPGHERMSDATVDALLAGLPTAPRCAAADVTAFFRGRPAEDPVQRRAVDAATAYAATALVGCGDELRSGADWAGATDRYRQALASSPAAPVAARARQGITDAAAGRAQSDTQRRLGVYCDGPFAYPAAPAPGPGSRVHLAWPGYDGSYNPLQNPLRLPAARQAPDAGSAAVAVCVGRQESGSVARTCPYRGGLEIGTVDVAFRRLAFPVRIIEVRTGRLLFERRVEVDGASCPPKIETQLMISPGDRDVVASPADIETAVRDAVLPRLQG